MIPKVTQFLEEYHMIEEGDLVAAGVSGGADSLCLLFVLLEYQRKVPFDIVVVHVNHKIREDAARDAKLVEEICVKEKLPFYLVEEEVRKIAGEDCCSASSGRFGGNALVSSVSGNRYLWHEWNFTGKR